MSDLNIADKEQSSQTADRLSVWHGIDALASVLKIIHGDLDATSLLKVLCRSIRPLESGDEHVIETDDSTG